eukprot:670458-Prymnesium_polylepis.1
MGLLSAPRRVPACRARRRRRSGRSGRPLSRFWRGQHVARTLVVTWMGLPVPPPLLAGRCAQRESEERRRGQYGRRADFR